MEKKTRIILDFLICGFNNITHEEITNILGIEPVSIQIKDHKINPNLLLVAKENVWRMSTHLDDYTSFETKMNALLDIIEDKFELFKKVCHGHYCEFSCALYLYESENKSTPWIHLNERYHKIATQLNAEFDFDIYYW